VVIGRAVHEGIGFNKESLNRSMRMTVPTMAPNTDFKQLKRNFLTFLSLKVAYPIPQLTVRESGVRLIEAAHNYAYVVVWYISG
jgi:hypothetical protein